MSAPEEKIRVAIRVRPLVANANTNTNTTANSPGPQESVALSPDGNSVYVYSDAAHSNAAAFRCERFLPGEITQDDAFAAISGAELVESALDGFRVTLFAYGQTGAGKSFSIFGHEDAQAARSSNVCAQDGILPRAAQHLMRLVDERKAQVQYTLRVTSVEIYNEQVRDLFDAQKDSLPVRHAKDHGFYLENATVVECGSASEMIRVVKLAATNRVRSSHLLNARSNRSHCLVTIYIDSAPRGTDGDGHGHGLGSDQQQVKKYGKLTIVDLAGSERANDTGAMGQQLKETGHINKSLYCLSQVILAMAHNAKHPTTKPKFVPYRDSKLTMLLIDSLGGNSKTLMLACVNSAPQFANESIRTLEFAMGVAKIKNRPTAVLNPHEKLINDLKEQIRLLKLENLMLRSRTPGYFTEHPERSLEDVDPSEPVASPLGKALLSARHRPDNLRMSVDLAAASRLRHATDDNRDMRPRVTRRASTSEKQSAAARSLVTVKTKLAQRSKSPKKKLKKQTPSSRTSQSVTGLGSVSLPPVNQSSLLFQRRALPNTRTPTLAMPQPVPQRPLTPPPGYDDLFGIETVAISVSDSRGQLVKPTVRSSASNAADEDSTSSPGAHLQQLLRDMMTPPSEQQQSRDDTLRASPPASAGSNAWITVSSHPVARLRRSDSYSSNQGTYSHSNSSKSLDPKGSAVTPPEFDDERAEELFSQLCRL